MCSCTVGDQAASSIDQLFASQGGKHFVLFCHCVLEYLEKYGAITVRDSQKVQACLEKLNNANEQQASPNDDNVQQQLQALKASPLQVAFIMASVRVLARVWNNFTS